MRKAKDREIKNKILIQACHDVEEIKKQYRMITDNKYKNVKSMIATINQNYK